MSTLVRRGLGINHRLDNKVFVAIKIESNGQFTIAKYATISLKIEIVAYFKM